MAFLSEPYLLLEFFATNVLDYCATRALIRKLGLKKYAKMEDSIGGVENTCQILETFRFGVPPMLGKQLAQYQARREIALNEDRLDFDFYHVVDTNLSERDFREYMRNKGRILVFNKDGDRETLITSDGANMSFLYGRSERVEHDPLAFLPYVFMGVVARISAENFNQVEWRHMFPKEATIHLEGHRKVKKLFPIRPEESFYAECNDGMKAIYDYAHNELWRYWI